MTGRQLEKIGTFSSTHGALPSTSDNEHAGSEVAIFKYPKRDLFSYKEGLVFRGAIMEVESPEHFFVVDINNPEAKILKPLAMEKDLPQYKRLPQQGEVFGVVIGDLILRAVLDPQSVIKVAADVRYSLFLIDIGEVVEVPSTSIMYKLEGKYRDVPAQAMLCSVHNLERNNNPFLYTKEYLLELLHIPKRFRVGKVEKGVVFVELEEVAASPVRIQPTDDNANQFTKEELDMLYEEPLGTTNALKAVMGYVPRDDQRICPHYDPKTRGCFKGINCRREHILRDPEGFTKDQKPAFTIWHDEEPLLHVEPGTTLRIIPTFVKSLSHFYAQMKCDETPLLWNDVELQHLQPLKRLPLIHDMVRARYVDGLWYRAMVLNTLEGSPKVLVFYVDYGNEQIVNLSELKPYDKRCINRPFQATLCAIANVQENPKLKPRSRELGLAMVRNFICNKSCEVTITWNSETRQVVFTEEPYKDFIKELIASEWLLATK